MIADKPILEGKLRKMQKYSRTKVILTASTLFVFLLIRIFIMKGGCLLKKKKTTYSRNMSYAFGWHNTGGNTG